MSRKRESYSSPTWFQRFTSFFVLFFFLFNLTVHIPMNFLWNVFADDTAHHDLVAVLVSESIYDDIESEVKRYAKDIQGVLPNTKTLIIPTPDDVEVFQVASLLEWLYYDGAKTLDKNIDYSSQLVWTVLVWDIPVPIVHNQDAFSKTILPYVDFKDKMYIYSHEEKKYIKSEKKWKWNNSWNMAWCYFSEPRYSWYWMRDLYRRWMVWY